MCQTREESWRCYLPVGACLKRLFLCEKYVVLSEAKDTY